SNLIIFSRDRKDSEKFAKKGTGGGDHPPFGTASARSATAVAGCKRRSGLLRGGANVLFDALVALVTLTAMEIVLGVDNIIFLAILVGRLPPPQQPLARRLGLGVALGTRLLLLCLLSVLLQLNAPLFRLTSLGVPAGWLRPSP